MFLIGVALYIASLGLYALFVDSTLPLPRWPEVHDLDDLKNNLVSVAIAVLAVLFPREAVAWDGSATSSPSGRRSLLWWSPSPCFSPRRGSEGPDAPVSTARGRGGPLPLGRTP